MPVLSTDHRQATHAMDCRGARSEPESLAAGTFTPAFGTAMNRPREYGPHWEGFGKRYGMRFTGISTSNAMKAAVGALWGEDPRYFRAAGQPFKGRIKNVVVMTFAARQADGMLAPAYARYSAMPATTSFPTPGGRTASPALGDACVRTALGLPEGWAATLLPNSGPIARRYMFHRKH